MEHERVPKIIPRYHNGVKVNIQLDAPVKDNGITRHRKGTQPKRQNVDRQVKSGLNFESADFRASRHPWKRFSVILIVSGMWRQVRMLISFISVHPMMDDGRQNYFRILRNDRRISFSNT
jgi:hypothetical protein